MDTGVCWIDDVSSESPGERRALCNIGGDDWNGELERTGEMLLEISGDEWEDEGLSGEVFEEGLVLEKLASALLSFGKGHALISATSSPVCLLGSELVGVGAIQLDLEESPEVDLNGGFSSFSVGLSAQLLSTSVEGVAAQCAFFMATSISQWSSASSVCVIVISSLSRWRADVGAGMER
jgi:hypothetical protein